MVKSRKTNVKARPLPNLYSVKKTPSGAIVSRRFSAEGGSAADNGLNGKNNGVGSSNRSMMGNSATVSKRVIFPHLTRLHHGILRYRNVSESPTSVATSAFPGTDNNDRRFVFVPAGYSIQNDKSLHEILLALGLHGLPPLVIVTAATDGAVEETVDDQAESANSGKTLLLGNPISNDLDLTEEEERELLKEKTQEILRSTVSLCGETGAWILPHRPRRVNGAAETLCYAVSSVASKVDGEDGSISKNKAVVLGMIGLDQQDEQDGFTELLTSNMHPVGTEIEHVAVVSYDPNVRDNTPCPELTHLLLFQRRQEMRAFRERLLAHTPDVFMAFGRTTPYAKKCLFSTLLDQSPVALITHTSPEIDHMSWMLRHADHEIRKIEVGESDPPSKGTATFAVSGDPTTYATLPLPPLPELSGADPELADFLPIWPASHRDERMVLADPRRVGGLQFQRQLLRAVNAAFYIPQARAIALQESSDLLTAIRTRSSQQNRVTERFHFAMVLATLTAVVAAVMYAKIFGADPAPSWNNRNPGQIALFLVTIGVPFSILYMKRLYDDSSRLWSQLQNEAALLESTIYHFRTRPRTFGQQSSGSHHGDPEPLDAFIRRVCEILKRVSPFVGDYFGGANSQGEGHTQALAETKTQVDPTYDIEANSTYDIEAPPATETSPLLPSAPSISFPELAVNGSTNKWKKKAHYDDDMDDRARIQNDDTRQSEEADQVEASSLLTIKNYIERRIKAGQQQKKDELAVLEKRNNLIELIIKLVLGSTSLLALMSEQWFIPIVLGVSAAFVASQDFRKYKTRVEKGQAMIQKLDDLLSWWDALGEDKILASNEDRLVETAEGIFVADDCFTY